MRFWLAVVVAASLVAAAGADQVIYSNEDQAQTYVPWTTPGMLAVDDLHVVGGGQLSALSFAIGSNRWGGPVTTDATVILAVDDGNGTYGAEDTQLLSVPLTGLVAPNPGPQGQLRYLIIDVPLSGIDAFVPDNSLVWAGVQFSSFGRLIIFSPPTIGTTDDSIYVNGQAYSVTDLGFPGSGTGWQLAVTPEPASFLLCAWGLLALRRR